MSNKVNSFRGSHFELYKEWLAEDYVHLSLDGFEFEVSKGKVTVKIPTPLWDVLRTYSGCVTDLAHLDDTALLTRAENIVDDRIARYSGKKAKNPLVASFYQDASKPRKIQVREMLRRLLQDRDSQRKMIRQIKANQKQTTPEVAEKRSEAMQRSWKILGRRAEKRKLQSERIYKAQQARYEKIIGRLLHLNKAIISKRP